MIALFCVVVGGLLAGTDALIYALFDRQVGKQLDRELLEAAKPIMADLIADPTEQSVATLDLTNQYLELLDPAGRLLQASRNLGGIALDIGDLAVDASKSSFRFIQSSHGRLRMALIPFQQGRESVVLAMAVPTRDTDQEIADFRRMLLIMLPVSLGFMAAISAWYVGRSLRPITELTRRASELTQNISDPGGADLESPLPVVHPHDELSRLSSTFNQLFARLNGVLRQLRQFVSDAAHELRTPLAVLQGETELLLCEPRSNEQYQKTLRVIDGELKKLAHIVDGLFTLSMADVGQLRLSRDQLHLEEVVEEACGLAVPAARAKAIVIERDLANEVIYRGDETLLRQLFLIFLENAVKYSSANTRIQVRLARVDGVARVSFTDQGMGIPPEHVPHIFERFYRAAPEIGEARSGGLGLAIAQAIVNAQGGSIECDTAIGQGSTFTVTLPLTGSDAT